MKQLSIFDFYKVDMFIDKPIRLIELFAGYGSTAMALKNLGANFEHYKISEWCIPSVNMYHAVHTDGNLEKCEYSKDEAVEILLKYGVSMDGKQPLTEDNLKRKSVEWLNDVIAKFRASNNLGSITNFHGKDLEIVDTDRYSYLLTYSYPCTDLSVAGKMAGMSYEDWQNGKATRSGLLWEVMRLLQELNHSGREHLPQILLMENVPQVHSSSNIKDFQRWLEFLESIGYSNYYMDLNARNYGIAQNRNRCFCVSMLGNYTFEFPEQIPLTKTMKDYLEEEVDRKYYITSDKARELIDKLILSGQIPKKVLTQNDEAEHACQSVSQSVSQGDYRLVNQ